VTTPPSEQPNEPSATTEPWGRVSDDGTVYVRTADGERPVGQMPDASPEEALAFFTKRYDDLAFEVDLLEQRVKAGTVGPDEAAAAVKQVHATLAEAQAVGDLAGLDQRLDALSGTIDAQREKRKVERAAKLEAARGAKERIASEAEKLAEGNDWRNGANRLRDLLDEWKALPRLEKSVDDALWRRFSTARTNYTRRRKAHFGELNEKREGARAVKERLVKEAEALADSTEWGPTAGKYRDLMRQWKAAGPAPRGVDDQLWKRFRAAQDTFFGARDAAAAETDREFAANAEKKEALLLEAEKLVPVTDLKAAKEAFRDIAERWDAAGKVPRERMKELEGRIRKVEQEIRGVEDDQWRRSNPEARARAADTVGQLESSIADLEAKHQKALAAGNEKKAAEHASALEARRAWLTEAQKALEDFS
jgi:soluble cytochrome b562